jgi:hypothetical protein
LRERLVTSEFCARFGGETPPSQPAGRQRSVA